MAGAIALGCALVASAAYWRSHSAQSVIADSTAAWMEPDAADPRRWSAVPAKSDIDPLQPAAMTNTAAAAEFSFLPPIEYVIPSARSDDKIYPRAVAVGDVTGDGRDDLVVSSVSYQNNPPYLQPNAQKVQVYVQQTDGTLAAPIVLDYSRPGGPSGNARGLDLADMNGDGVMDIAIVFPAGAAIFVNNGVGGFHPPKMASPPSSTSAESAIAMLDYNQDGRLDVLGVGHSGSIVAYLGDGNGGFLAGPPPQLSGAIFGDCIPRVADVTGDGLPDLVFTTDYNATLVVRTQLSGGGLSSMRGYYSPKRGKRAFGLTVGDFNQDGRNDAAFSGSLEYDASDGTLAIYHQNANGLLDEPMSVSWLTSKSLYMALAADLDRDGRTDLAVLDLGSSNSPAGLGIYLQGDNGLLPPRLDPRPATTSDISAPHGIAAGDLNGDGCTDVVYATGTASVVNHGRNCKPRRLPVPPQDLDGDGDNDMIWHHSTGYLATWTMEDGARLTGTSYTVARPWRVLATDDFNGDGRSEMVWSDGQSMQMWRSNGAGGYIGLPMANYPVGYRLITHGDIDGDGKADLVWRDGPSSVVAIWYMDGATVARGHASALPWTWQLTGTGDLNGDGRTDLLISDMKTLRLWSGRGDAGFVDSMIGVYPAGWNFAGSGDSDGNGRSELFWRLPRSEHFVRWIMDGSRRTAGISYRQGASWNVLDVADYNGDGRDDVVWSDDTQMQLWRAQDRGFGAQAMPAYPSGWVLKL